VVVQDAKQKRGNFLEWRMEHVPRHVNREAHNLVKLALSLQVEQTWISDFPRCIFPREFVLQDSI
jgi:hypothetical protein